MPIGKIKAGGVPLVTLAVAGISKPILEGVIANTPLGNGTVISGAGKLVGAMAVRQFVGSGEIMNGVQIALAVDGIEDIMKGFLSGSLFGGNPANVW